MTTVIINNKKRGAQEILGLLRTLSFATFTEFVPNDIRRLRRQKLIKIPQKYDPLALAGLAENTPLDLSQIRKEWTKKFTSTKNTN